MNLQRRYLSLEIYRALQRAVSRLSSEAKERIGRFVLSQCRDGAAFINRAGQPDLYYSFFGWTLCSVLDIHSDAKAREAYLNQINREELDDFHKLIYDEAYEMHRLLKVGILRYSMRWIARGMPDALPAFFEAYVQRSPQSQSVNILAANLIRNGLDNGFNQHAVEADLGRLYRMQDDSGGWRQNEGISIPDMLSTSVALFALAQYGKQPCYVSSYFVDAHWQEDGSFAPNLYDRQSDVEYVFYGLLALGA